MPGISSPFNSVGYFRINLGLADSEHLGATGGADALGRWLSILHGNAFGGLHLLLGAAFDTISLHIQPSSCFYHHIKPFDTLRSSGNLPFGNKKESS